MTDPLTLQVHGTCVVFAEIGVLLCGPSGSGKSDLALRLLDCGAQLVADDRVDLERRGDAIWATAPGKIAGLLEVRGIGIVHLDGVAGACADRAKLGLVVDLTDRAAIERLPEAAGRNLLGIDLPCLPFDPWAASAVAKLRVAAGLARQGKLFAH
ncbi:MAG: HPr kinase/phosphatase C-terminal domain-containing protein [Rhodospirillales bacterium]|nr:HPr kinase/phosphatase C-terminal domain-containing protein [Rhodospirillales bacterium]